MAQPCAFWLLCRSPYLARNPTPEYREADIIPHMKGQEIHIEVALGIGDGNARIWTCDLTHGYIDINADYRS